ILSTTLIVNPVFLSNENDSICQGDSLLIYGNYQNSAGVYYDSLQTINGCDSIFSTTLAIDPLPNVSIVMFNPDTVCLNGLLATLPTGTPGGGLYSGTGVVGSNFDPLLAGVGNHNVIYTFTDGNSCINSDTTVITVKICVGIDEIENDFGILIYPNPNTGLFTIEKPIDLNKEVKVKLLDATSKVIINKVIPIGKQKVEIDITSYSRGIYYLQLIVDEEIFVKQILKQ
ncbi:MAG: T9SS type A sorting domain-containing protein, partial [Flavobacteriales bacterium]|nr:T9SS type A sorting domain-containing protein [Flavobacteriales bacterium]